MTGLEILGLVGGLVRGRTESAPSDTGTTDFASLLEKAQQGDLRGSRAVDVDPGAGFSLSPAQLERLAIAADQLESQGVDRALVLMDDMALRLDVLTRRVIGMEDLQGGVLTEIEGVLALDERDGASSVTTESSGPYRLPRDGAMNASLQRVLARLP
ncbi:MAG: hypothetical protein KDA28_02680 [Phycisphaerales bacterium]|nr:hypothetical protein [Phycisphaerales bacterium]